MTFEQAVAQTPYLEGAWRDGLGALRAEDKTHIKAEDTRRLRGSVDLDKALQPNEPNAHRWDFAIAYQHTNRKEEFVYWVETHTASDSQINAVLKKLDWLKGWFSRDGQKMAKFEREIVWVPSGPTAFTKGATQVKILATKGIRYSGAVLRIPKRHPTSNH
ncbi:MAG: hypothetical protein HY043_02130 [Verrucomicrobia bacterium]|nr:hypothetical protein [Verrucomicrobiota bacterium]